MPAHCHKQALSVPLQSWYLLLSVQGRMERETSSSTTCRVIQSPDCLSLGALLSSSLTSSTLITPVGKLPPFATFLRRKLMGFSTLSSDPWWVLWEAAGRHPSVHCPAQLLPHPFNIQHACHVTVHVTQATSPVLSVAESSFHWPTGLPSTYIPSPPSPRLPGQNSQKLLRSGVLRLSPVLVSHTHFPVPLQCALLP